MPDAYGRTTADSDRAPSASRAVADHGICPCPPLGDAFGAAAAKGELDVIQGGSVPSE
ncbi:hypothetical protein [Streptomyces sp. NPDC005760]|uniref:hypothetical protein n=1 Tax=Streptomyces sp. NPDC005760 TaxID=3156718 RepID=UPI0033F05A28